MPFLIYKDCLPVTGDLDFTHSLDAGIGIFESMRTYGGKIFREKEHLKRLLESAKTVGFEKELNPAELKSILHRTIQTHCKSGNEKGELFVRMTLWADEVYVMIGSRVHPPEIYENGILLRTAVARRSSSNAAAPETKTTSYLNAVLGALGPREDRPYEWMFLGAGGYVSEVSIGNLFIVNPDGGKSVLLTPPLQGILNGVTRRFVIECALQCGFTVKEIPFTRHDVYTAAEAFLTNTSWEILPVRGLDGRKIGNKIPGAVTSKLQSKFKQKVLQECQK